MLGVLLPLALVLAGCGAGTVTRRPAGGDPLTGLSDAIAATNASRAAALTALAGADAAAADTERADQDALAGDRAAAGPVLSRADTEVRAAAAAAAGTRSAATSYAEALGALAGAAGTAPLSAAQEQAVAGVVTAGRREATALRTAADAYARAWPAYLSVVGVEQAWYAHANAGWFATAQESGGAYQVARLPDTPALRQAGAALAATDAGRRAASGPMQTALARGRAALAALT